MKANFIQKSHLFAFIQFVTKLQTMRLQYDIKLKVIKVQSQMLNDLIFIIHYIFNFNILKHLYT